MSDAIKNVAAQFFYEHAGQSHPAGLSSVEIETYHVAGAYEMALAEMKAATSGHYYEWWEDDQNNHEGHDCPAFECDDDSDTYPLVVCVMNDSDEYVITSLGGIDLGPGVDVAYLDTGLDRPAYCRVVEAELALQEIGTDI